MKCLLSIACKYTLSVHVCTLYVFIYVSYTVSVYTELQCHARHAAIVLSKTKSRYT